MLIDFRKFSGFLVPLELYVMMYFVGTAKTAQSTHWIPYACRYGFGSKPYIFTGLQLQYFINF